MFPNLTNVPLIALDFEYIAKDYIRFFKKVEPCPVTGCWEWTAAKVKGYGIFWQGGKRCNGGRNYQAHRWLWETLNGPVPMERELDHLCRNRGCVNPEHLEPVTRSVNNLRGLSPARTRQFFLDKTHCPKGHPYSGDNLFVGTRSNGRNYRQCRICMRAWGARTREKSREKRKCILI